MKKIILFLLALVVFIGCNPEDIPDTKGKIDPNAMIVIKPAKGVQLRSTVSGLTALEIVQQATTIQLQTRYFDDVDVGVLKVAGRGFNELTMKDYDIPALKMLAIDVINAQGEYIRDFTHAQSVYIVKVDNNSNIDTLATIPDEVLYTARPLIETAYENEDYDEVYRLFNEAYTFIPIE